jgi:hypothetical protein
VLERLRRPAICLIDHADELSDYLFVLAIEFSCSIGLEVTTADREFEPHLSFRCFTFGVA